MSALLTSTDGRLLSFYWGPAEYFSGHTVAVASLNASMGPSLVFHRFSFITINYISEGK